MSTPIYCILSAGAVHCIPVAVFNSTADATPEKLARTPTINSVTESLPLPPRPLGLLAIRNRNLLYTLNNPSLLDLESDVSRHMSAGSQTQDEDDVGEVLGALNDKVLDVLNGKSDKVAVSLPETANGKPPNIEVLASLDDLQELQPSRYIEIRASAVDDDIQQTDVSSVLDSYLTHAVYLPQYLVDLEGNLGSNYTQIKTLLSKIFPSWSHDIDIKQLTGGITNMLLSCHHHATDERLLMRVYGPGTNLIIDRNREFVSHLVLNSLQLAPPIHARFANGLIYGFLPGRSLAPHELYNGYIFPLIAQQLGRWHNSVNCDSIEEGVGALRKYTAEVKKNYDLALGAAKTAREPKKRKSINNLWDLIEDWISVVPVNDALVAAFAQNLPDAHVTADTVVDVIHGEFRWLRKTLKHATKSPIVVSHCDLLSGNIIVPDIDDFVTKCAGSLAELPPLEENPIQFIDYEYMLPAPRGFDIANHFAEWQGFDCNRDAIPKPSFENPTMVSWCKGYLNDMHALESTIRALIDEISCYYGMPGFYWGIWAMIQSKLSTIDFNYADYSVLRLEEYWLWKQQYLAGTPKSK